MNRSIGEHRLLPRTGAAPLDVELCPANWVGIRNTRRPPLKKSRQGISTALRAIQYFFVFLSILCLGYVAATYSRAGIFQWYQSWRFDRMLAQRAASQAKATPNSNAAA